MIGSEERIVNRIAAVALLIGCLIGLATLGWLPVRWIAWQEARLRALERETAELQRRSAEREEMLSERQLIERALAEPGLVLRAATPAVAAAELQGAVTTMVQARGGRIASVQVLEPIDLGGLSEVGLRIVFEIEMDGLIGLLHALETSEPLVLIRRLTLQAERRANGAEPTHLRTELELAALSRRL